jgi:hypothetical protein
LADPASSDAAKLMMTHLDSLYRYADKLGRDLLFHFSFLMYVYSSETEGGEKYRFKFFNMDTGIPEEPARIALVAKAGAFLHNGKGIDLTEKVVTFQGKQQTLLEVLRENCATNQLNLKTSAFRVLKDAFDKIGKQEQLLAQFNADKATGEAIFELVMQNWEFPIRGFANAMEDVFANYITLFPGEDERLQLMKSILLKYPSKTRRKYASLRLLLKGVDIDKYLQCAPDLMKEILTFEAIGTAPFVVQLFKELLNQAYLKYSKIYKDSKDKDKLVEEWTNFWIKDYIAVVSSGTYDHVSGINEQINPQIFNICEKSLPIVISKLFEVKCQSTTTFQSVQASLLRYARSRDIFVCENNQFKLIGLEKQNTVDWKTFVKDIICHNNRHIALDALRIIVEPKKDSLNPQAIEYELLERAIIYNTKNSYPDFRNDMSVTIKKFLHRLRNNLNPAFKKSYRSKELRRTE